MPDVGLPLAGDYLQRLSGGATLEQTQAILNDVINRLNGLLQSQVFSDGSNKRYLSGYQAGGWPTGDFGVKISIPGVDVTVATVAQLLFSWDWTNNTQYWYNPADSNHNFMQIGIMPNGKGGEHVAKPGTDVADSF